MIKTAHVDLRLFLHLFTGRGKVNHDTPGALILAIAIPAIVTLRLPDTLKLKILLMIFTTTRRAFKKNKNVRARLRRMRTRIYFVFVLYLLVRVKWSNLRQCAHQRKSCHCCYLGHHHATSFVTKHVQDREEEYMKYRTVDKLKRHERQLNWAAYALKLDGRTFRHLRGMLKAKERKHSG